MKTTRSTEATNAVAVDAPTATGRRPAPKAASALARRPACAQRRGLPFATLAFAALAGSPVAGWAQLPDPDAEARAAAERFAGSWTGAIEVPGAGVTLRMRLQATVDDDGGLAATFFSVDQGNAAIPVEGVEVDGASVSLSMATVGAAFKGVLSEDGTKIEGTFTQMGAALALTLERAAEGDDPPAAPRRPQDPEEPFPYHAEDVTFPNPDGGHVLAGTFTRPAAGGPFPGVILISGSGPQDRDEALMGHRPFLVLSDYLTRSGLAVLRFDDRGVGESGGDFATATSRDFASDAAAGVAYLKSRDDVDPARIGLAGHSEGGLIAPMVAAESDDVAFIVLMAGPGTDLERILYAQSALIGRASGASEESIAKSHEQQREIFRVLRTEQDLAQASEEIEAIVREALENAADEERARAGVTDELPIEKVAAAHAAQMATPWFRYFLTYDPAESLERVTVPVLAINGEKDLQVPYEENLRAIEAALRRGGNDRFETHALPDHNHLFQHAETGSPAEYATIDETWSVESMELIAQWILKTVGGVPTS